MKTMTISIPRRQGWRVVGLILWELFRAYRYRVPSITFEMHEE